MSFLFTYIDSLTIEFDEPAFQKAYVPFDASFHDHPFIDWWIFFQVFFKPGTCYKKNQLSRRPVKTPIKIKTKAHHAMLTISNAPHLC
jgi:hypothetical protein